MTTLDPFRTLGLADRYRPLREDLARFDRVCTRGFAYSYWGPEEVPRLNEALLSCVVYLFPSEHDAEQTECAGGSGFLVGYPGPSGFARHLYIVTNRHVALLMGETAYARVNTTDGKFGIVPIPRSAWAFNPSGHDVAVAKLGLSDAYEYNYVGAPDDFVNESEAERFGIGIGDELVMVGRFITQQGTAQNTPVARHGHIAMMAREPIKIETYPHPQWLILGELRSEAGFSGSPVFVYIPPESVRPGDWTLGTRTDGKPYARLIGIECASATGYAPIVNSGQPIGSMISSYKQGMSWIVPADFIMETLNMPKLKKARDKQDKPKNPGITLDIAMPAKPARGPKPERVKLEGDYADRVKDSFKAPPMPKKSKGKP